MARVLGKGPHFLAANDIGYRTLTNGKAAAVLSIQIHQIASQYSQSSAVLKRERSDIQTSDRRNGVLGGITANADRGARDPRIILRTGQGVSHRPSGKCRSASGLPVIVQGSQFYLPPWGTHLAWTVLACQLNILIYILEGPAHTTR